MSIIITKASGKKESFVKSKLHHSLMRVGATATLATQIVNEIEQNLTEGTSTRDIYKRAHKLLRKSESPMAARYNLKNAIMQLGPSGYPFEKYIGEILKHQGYSVEVGTIVQGHCVNHEIDVIAEKDNHHFMIECKFHHKPGINCDVKIPLYIYSRFKDVEEQWVKLPGHGTKFHQGWVVTNTRFTQDAIQYGTCRGMNLLSWDYPLNEGLKDIIDRLGLYPITCLTSLTQAEKQTLLDDRIVLCSQICHNENLLVALGLKASRIKTVMDEATKLCQQIIQLGKHGQA